MSKGARHKPAPGSDACPCGGPTLAACCGPYLAGTEVPARADLLMRSRYTAYVLGDTAYLRVTWDPATCPASLDDGTPTQWLGLKVLTYTPRDETHAEVEFVARYKINGRAYRLHERSRFIRTDGRWRYVDGDMLA
jgi:SEC-C motif-containing protein